ncbi:DUF4334 domain-containing protein [Acinetobacter sp. ESL0695]|uniref:DUF4334 domain-containing protein n=1 Tax=Acinetobacter sp. ESL0695 TaxID=2983215 RepID=UPI0023EF9501|nr:DUF4334 domain-containing protein [Acinetobacter sp. ESL0695]WEV49530.1 DUF4334 domain-containing protein [Acinetobacter sp. ESL0695]
MNQKTAYTDQFNQLKDKSYESADELIAFFDTLPEISIENIYGKWKSELLNGPWDVDFPIKIKSFGKWFRSKFDIDPVICYNEHGELFSNKKVMHGSASLWNIDFRGKTSATLVYDHVPLFGHFRQVDENIVMGVMSGKPFEGSPEHLHKDGNCVFYLERIQEFPAKFVES